MFIASNLFRLPIPQLIFPQTSTLKYAIEFFLPSKQESVQKIPAKIPHSGRIACALVSGQQLRRRLLNAFAHCFSISVREEHSPDVSLN